MYREAMYGWEATYLGMVGGIHTLVYTHHGRHTHPGIHPPWKATAVMDQRWEATAVMDQRWEADAQIDEEREADAQIDEEREADATIDQRWEADATIDQRWEADAQLYTHREADAQLYTHREACAPTHGTGRHVHLPAVQGGHIPPVSLLVGYSRVSLLDENPGFLQKAKKRH